MSYKRFAEDVKKEQFKKVYIFHGNEKYLMEKFTQQAKSCIVQEAFEDFNYQVFDGEQVDFGHILQAMETLPLMQDKKLIVVKNAPYFKQVTPTDQQIKQYKQLIGDEQSSFIVLFQCAEGVDKRKKLYKETLEKGSEIEFGRLEPKEFEKWIGKRLKDHRISCSEKTMLYLLDILGYSEYHSTKNLYLIEGEIKQLCDYVGSGELTTEHIQAVLRKTVEGNIFVVIDSFSSGDHKKALHLIDDMLLYGEPEIRILFMLARHFRLLYRTRLYLDAGYGPDSIAQELKVQRFQLQKMMQQCRGVSLKGLEKIIAKIAYVDHAIKSGGMASKVALDFVLGYFYLLYQNT